MKWAAVRCTVMLSEWVSCIEGAGGLQMGAIMRDSSQGEGSIVHALKLRCRKMKRHLPNGFIGPHSVNRYLVH